MSIKGLCFGIKDFPPVAVGFIGFAACLSSSCAGLSVESLVLLGLPGSNILLNDRVATNFGLFLNNPDKGLNFVVFVESKLGDAKIVDDGLLGSSDFFFNGSFNFLLK